MSGSENTTRDPVAFVTDGTITIASRDAPHLVPILRQAREGRLVIIKFGRDFSIPPSILNGLDVPTLIVVPALDGVPAKPKKWRGVPGAIEWAQLVVIRGTGPVEVEYTMIGIAAEAHGRAVLIECASADVAEWQGIVTRRNPRAHVAVFMPPEGEVYPEAAVRERLQ